MDAKNYAEQLQKERMRIKDNISIYMEPRGLSLSSLQITDEGYVVEAKPISKEERPIPFSELCRRVDLLEIKNFSIVDITFSLQKVTMIVVPTVEDSMNDFIWNYIMCYLPFADELEALSMAVGVLEHMVESLDDEVRSQYDKFITLLIQ